MTIILKSNIQIKNKLLLNTGLGAAKCELSYAAGRNVMTEESFENNLAISFDLELTSKNTSQITLKDRKKLVNKDIHY